MLYPTLKRSDFYIVKIATEYQRDKKIIFRLTPNSTNMCTFNWHHM